MQITEFVMRFRALEDEEKREFVGFFIPVFAARSHRLKEPRPFEKTMRIDGELESLMKDFGKLNGNGELVPQIVDFLEQNQMCERRTDTGVPEGGGESGEQLQFTLRILLAVEKLAGGKEDRFVSVSEVSDWLADKGCDRSKVGGSVTSLLTSGFLEKREEPSEDGRRERHVALTGKGRERVGKCRSQEHEEPVEERG